MPAAFYKFLHQIYDDKQPLKNSQIAIWQVLASFMNIQATCSQFLPAQMASLIFLEKFWIEFVASKNPRIHTGFHI